MMLLASFVHSYTNASTLLHFYTRKQTLITHHRLEAHHSPHVDEAAATHVDVDEEDAFIDDHIAHTDDKGTVLWPPPTPTTTTATTAAANAAAAVVPRSLPLTTHTDALKFSAHKYDGVVKLKNILQVRYILLFLLFFLFLYCA
jgi:hypothetical protein